MDVYNKHGMGVVKEAPILQIKCRIRIGYEFFQHTCRFRIPTYPDRFFCLLTLNSYPNVDVVDYPYQHIGFVLYCVPVSVLVQHRVWSYNQNHRRQYFDNHHDLIPKPQHDLVLLEANLKNTPSKFLHFFLNPEQYTLAKIFQRYY